MTTIKLEKMRTIIAKPLIGFWLLLLLSAIAGYTQADEPSSALDRSPSVDSVANAPVSTDNPSDQPMRPGAQASYVYDLKRLIDQSRSNIKNVNEKIKEQAVIKRNQKREEKAREYYEMGQKLTDEGKLDEARQYFEKAIRITEHPEMTGYIKESQKRLRAQEAALRKQDNERTRQLTMDEKTKEQDVAQSYTEAISLYRQRKFQAAKEAFEHIEELIPDYKATQSYLKIIDQDILVQDQVTVKQQKVQLERQQQEAEVARAKEKEAWRKEIEQKERERKNQLSKQADDVYVQAVDLYKDKKYKEAKAKFQEVAWVFPDYKATNNYLKRIDGDIEAFDKQQTLEQQKLLEKQRWEEEVAKSKLDLERRKQQEIEEKAKLKQLQDQAAFTYESAVNLFDKGLLDEAKEKFDDIEKILPGFKSVRIYIAKIEKINLDKARREKEAKELEDKRQRAQLSKEEQAKKDAEEKRIKEEMAAKQKALEAEVASLYQTGVNQIKQQQYEAAKETFMAVNSKLPNYKQTLKYLNQIVKKIGGTVPMNSLDLTPTHIEPVKVITPLKSAVTAKSVEDQMKESQEIMDLAAQSESLLNQMSALGDDRSTQAVKKKLAQFNSMMNEVKESHDRVIREARSKMLKEEQEKFKAQQELREKEAEGVYNLALDLLRRQEFEQAKMKLLEVENIFPNYKAVRDYLSNIETNKQKVEILAKAETSRLEEEKLRQMQEREKNEAKEREVIEQRRQADLRKAQQEQLQSLSKRASDINDEIIALTKKKQYADVKTKFAELQGIVTSYKALKDIVNQQEEQDRIKTQQAKERARLLAEAKQANKEEKKQLVVARLTEHEKKLYPDKRIEETAKAYRLRDETRQLDMLYNQGVDLYDQKKYSQSRLIFEELKRRHDRRASGWISKLDHVIGTEVVKFKKEESKQQTDYLAERMRIAHKANVVEQKERDRQRRLAVEYERQRQAAEDARQEDQRRIEATRLQQEDRLRQQQIEERRKQEERQREEVFRFRKVDEAKKNIKKELKKDVKKEVKEEVKKEVKKEAEANSESKQSQDQKPVDLEAEAKKAKKEREEQLAISKKRKAYFEDLYQKQQKQEKVQAKRKVELENSFRATAGEKAFNERLKRMKKSEKPIVQKKVDENSDEKVVEVLPVVVEETKVDDSQIKKEQQRIAELEKRNEEIRRNNELLAKRKEEIAKQKEEALQRKSEEEKRREEKLRQEKEALEKRRQEAEKQRELLIKQREEIKRQKEEAVKRKEQQRSQLLEEQRIQAEKTNKEREEKLKALEAARQEEQRKADLDKQIKAKQVQIESQRMALRKQMEAETEVMYQQALQLFRQGDYDRAINKFQDVEDVFPNYKQTRAMINKARNAREVKSPSVTLKPVIVNKAEIKSASNSNRHDAIAKSLDLFDPDAK